jgi:DNA-binding response OmpR family regulator
MQTRPRRILIVDDNVSLAENIAEILAIDGYATTVAASAEEVLSRLLPAATFDVVVTDRRLPDSSGANLVRRIRALGLPVRAVVISACTDELTIADARSAGATFVAKPLDLAILGRLIRSADAAAS